MVILHGVSFPSFTNYIWQILLHLIFLKLFLTGVKIFGFRVKDTLLANKDPFSYKKIQILHKSFHLSFSNFLLVPFFGLSRFKHN